MKGINATHYDRIPAYPSAAKKRRHIVNAVIETPKRSCHKFALDPEYGIIAFKELLPKTLEWPYDFGFIPQTLAPDGDPLDLILINDHGLFSGCLIKARILGAIRETKDGTENDRLIGVPLPSPGAPSPTDDYKKLSDVPANILQEITGFLVDYSAREGHKVEIKTISDADAAFKTVKATRKAFKKGRKQRA